MPDPRSVTLSCEILIGYKDGSSDAFDEYGRKPWQRDYNDEDRRKTEADTFGAFQGEFARVFGPKRRGVSFELGVPIEKDSPEYHAALLRSEGFYKARAQIRRGRSRK